MSVFEMYVITKQTTDSCDCNIFYNLCSKFHVQVEILDLIKQRMIPTWSGPIPNPKSSYTTELEAITRISMILPSSWKITVWTDSYSTIDRIAARANEPIQSMNEPEWQLLSLSMHIDALRTEPVVLQHVKSHTNKRTPSRSETPQHIWNNRMVSNNPCCHCETQRSRKFDLTTMHIIVLCASADVSHKVVCIILAEGLVVSPVVHATS
jgi:hypothetical protein